MGHDGRTRVLGPVDRQYGWWVLGLGSIALGAALRFHGLSWESLWGDEWSTLRAGLKPTFCDVWSALGWDPPLYQLLLHYWFKVAGSSDAAGRFPAALFGTLCVAAVFYLGRRILNDRAAALSALVLAVMPFHIWYSQQIRSYGLFSLAAMVFFYFSCIAPRAGRVRSWVALGVSAAFLVHVHWPGFLLILCLFGWIAVGSVMHHWGRGRMPGEVLRGLLLSVAVLGILFAPLAVKLLSGLGGIASMGAGNAASGAPPVTELLHPIVGFFFSNTPVSDLVAGILALPLLGLFALGLLRARQSGLMPELLVATVVSVGLFWLACQWYNHWLMRFFMMTTPMVALVFGIALAELRPTYLRVVAVLMVLTVSSLSIGNMKLNHCRDEWREAAQYVNQHSTGQPAIFVLDTAELFTRYYSGPGAQDAATIGRALWLPQEKRFSTETFEMMDAEARGARQVWIVGQPGDRLDALRNWVLEQDWGAQLTGHVECLKVTAMGFSITHKGLD